MPFIPQILMIFEENLGIPQRYRNQPFCAAISENASPSWHAGSPSCDEDFTIIEQLILCACGQNARPNVGSTCMSRNRRRCSLVLDRQFARTVLTWSNLDPFHSTGKASNCPSRHVRLGISLALTSRGRLHVGTLSIQQCCVAMEGRTGVLGSSDRRGGWPWVRSPSDACA